MSDFGPKPVLKNIGPFNNEIYPTELKIWKLVCEGLGNQEIADRIGLEKKSVENELNTLYQKLNLSTAPTSGKRIRMAQLYPLDDIRRDWTLK